LDIVLVDSRGAFYEHGLGLDELAKLGVEVVDVPLARRRSERATTPARMVETLLVEAQAVLVERATAVDQHDVSKSETWASGASRLAYSISARSEPATLMPVCSGSTPALGK